MSTHALKEFRLAGAGFGAMVPPVHQIALSYDWAEDRRATPAGSVVILALRERRVRGSLSRLYAALGRLARRRAIVPGPAVAA
ncbi:MAG TPA: hypothetical protein VKX28_03820 [Xanthobacteraceae bacterium]|nr:hypothetical protein [Xanthobacteraceae bacterium]